MREARVLLDEILTACEQIEAYVADVEPEDLEEDQIRFDAVRYNLLVMGEAVKHLPRAILDSAPGLPWSAMARLRDHVAHRYYETQSGTIHRIATEDVPRVRRAVETILRNIGDRN